MAPSFAWNDMSEMDYNEQQQKREYLDCNDPHALQFTRYQSKVQMNAQTTKSKTKELKNANMEQLRSKYLTNEHHMFSDTFRVEDFDSNHGDITYSNQRFLQTHNLNSNATAFPSNQVDLIDIIGASRRYQTNEM